MKPNQETVYKVQCLAYVLAAMSPCADSTRTHVHTCTRAHTHLENLDILNM